MAARRGRRGRCGRRPDPRRLGGRAARAATRCAHASGRGRRAVFLGSSGVGESDAREPVRRPELMARRGDARRRRRGAAHDDAPRAHPAPGRRHRHRHAGAARAAAVGGRRRRRRRRVRGHRGARARVQVHGLSAWHRARLRSSAALAWASCRATATTAGSSCSASCARSRLRTERACGARRRGSSRSAPREARGSDEEAVARRTGGTSRHGRCRDVVASSDSPAGRHQFFGPARPWHDSSREVSNRHLPRNDAERGPDRPVSDDSTEPRSATTRARVIARFGWTCHAFCLIETHYRLIVDVEATLQPGMQSLNGPYTGASTRIMDAQDISTVTATTRSRSCRRAHAARIQVRGPQPGRKPALRGARSTGCGVATAAIAGLDGAFAFVDHDRCAPTSP